MFAFDETFVFFNHRHTRKCYYYALSMHYRRLMCALAWQVQMLMQMLDKLAFNAIPRVVRDFYISQQLNDSFRVFRTPWRYFFSPPVSLNVRYVKRESGIIVKLQSRDKHATSTRNELPNWDKNLRRGYKNILRQTRIESSDSNRW